MKEYVSHFSAAYHHGIPNLDAVIGAEIANRYRDGSIIDLTVSSPDMFYTKKGCLIHSCKKPLPYGALKKSNGILVASPELVFLELASKLDMHRLILLGLQMCSSRPNEKMSQ